MVLLDVVARLANDLEVPDHGVLGHFVLKERHFVDVFDVAINALDRLPNVPKVVDQPLLVARHTGTASASTM